MNDVDKCLANAVPVNFNNWRIDFMVSEDSYRSIGCQRIHLSNNLFNEEIDICWYPSEFGPCRFQYEISR